MDQIGYPAHPKPMPQMTQRIPGMYTPNTPYSAEDPLAAFFAASGLQGMGLPQMNSAPSSFPFWMNGSTPQPANRDWHGGPSTGTNEIVQADPVMQLLQALGAQV